jgi:hypothetical protein
MKTERTEDTHAQAEELERAERHYTTKKVPLVGDGGQALAGWMSRVRRIVVEPLFEGGRAQYTCMPIGVIPGVSLLIDWPRNHEGLAALKVGQGVKLKFFHDLNLTLIETEILALPFQPKAHVHLAWPKEVASVEVRDIRRIKVNTPSQFTIMAGDEVGHELVDGQLLDVSLSGAGFFCTQDRLSPGMRGKLLISVSPDDEREPVQSRPSGVVCARHPVTRLATPGWIYGIEFSHLTSPDRLLIWSMIGKASELKREDD